MEKQDKPPVGVIFFELVIKAHLKKAIFSVVGEVLHAEMPEIFDGLSLEENRELEQNTLAVLEKVFPEIILNLRNELTIIDKKYDLIRKKDSLVN